MEKQEMLKELKETRSICISMLSAIGMSLDVFLQYAQLSKEGQDKVVSKAIQRLEKSIQSGF